MCIYLAGFLAMRSMTVLQLHLDDLVLQSTGVLTMAPTNLEAARPLPAQPQKGVASDMRGPAVPLAKFLCQNLLFLTRPLARSLLGGGEVVQNRGTPLTLSFWKLLVGNLAVL